MPWLDDYYINDIYGEDEPVKEKIYHPYAQCGRELGAERFLGSVCGKCCRLNHKIALGKDNKNESHKKSTARKSIRP
jgi:hypothetical protein